jgi:Tfp pilus assembly protein FimT
MNGLWMFQRRNLRQRRAAMSLTQLLCVLAIMAILASLYLPAVFKAFVRVKKFLGGM